MLNYFGIICGTFNDEYNFINVYFHIFNCALNSFYAKEITKLALASNCCVSLSISNCDHLLCNYNICANIN